MQRQADLLNERGVSMAEVLIGAAMGTAVLVAILTVMINYQQNAQRTDRQLDAQARARVAVDRIVRDLRNVASSRTAPTLIESASPYDMRSQRDNGPQRTTVASAIATGREKPKTRRAA